MTPHRTKPTIAAAAVDPTTIDRRVKLGDQAEILVRRRPPGAVKLVGGHKEHLLMCTLGTPAKETPIRSTLVSDLGEQEWSLCPVKEVTFIPAGLPIEWEWSYDSRSVHVTMAPSMLSDDESDLPKVDPTPFFRVSHPALSNILWQLGEETISPGFGSDLATTSLLNLMKVYLRRGSRDDSKPVAHVRNAAGGLSDAQRRCAIELINDRLTRHISLSELSRACGLSPHHFTRMFKLSTGYPPHEYQLRLRVSRAQRLLRASGRVSVAAIACELGFTDESHFRRHFKRIVGATPSEYRKQQ